MSAPKRILIVDDDPDIHGLLSAGLSAQDRQIEGAPDGAAALRMIEALPFDLVITDVNMPELDGLALLERIQQARPGTRVVVMTVANTPETIIRAIRERAYAYFSKPFTLQAVNHIVDNALTSAPEEDDIEVLSARPNWLSLRLRCKMETADRILHFLQAMGTDLPMDDQQEVAMAFREILLNAIEHGGGSDPQKKVVVSFVRAERALLYYVRDPGKGFSFENLTHAAVANPLESPIEHIEVRQQMGMRPGGYGILMTRKLVDEMIYNESGNEVLLIKYLK
jgi:DNA-binding response OmpR family regulator